MARNPQHPGANHYYIHAVEASKTPDRATRQAGRLETLVPGAGHLVHMPAHIYIRTGQYARSAKSNADAAARRREVLQGHRRQQGIYPAMYYGHNLQFESAAAMFAGNFAEARDAARRTVDARRSDCAISLAMLEPFARRNGPCCVRFGQWDADSDAKAPAPTRTVQTSLYHFTRGAALPATGKVAEAEAASSRR